MLIWRSAPSIFISRIKMIWWSHAPRNSPTRHREEAEKILQSKASPDQKLRKYIFGRYEACKEVGTGSRHASELAREVIRLKPDRLPDEAGIMEGTIRACLDEGNKTGIFHCSDTTRDARVFLISVAYFFPNATMAISQWPAEPALKMVIDWFMQAWGRA